MGDPSKSRPESGLPPELQRDRDVERFAKAAKLPAYMWDTLGGLSALARFMDAVRSERGRWIAFVDQVPDGDGFVVACYADGETSIYTKRLARGYAKDNPPLTHWMPLPTVAVSAKQERTALNPAAAWPFPNLADTTGAAK